MELNLKDKVAIITGPAKGMGFDITRKFAEEGCRLVLIGRDIAAIDGAADETDFKQGHYEQTWEYLEQFYTIGGKDCEIY